MRGKINGNTWVTKTLWSQPASQMQLPSIEVWFVRKLWRCTLDEWRRLHFWPTRVSKIFLLASISSILWRFKSFQRYSSLIAIFWDKPKATWNKLTHCLVAIGISHRPLQKSLIRLFIAPHFSESAAGSPVRHCLRRQLASHFSFQYSVNCPSFPSYWPAHLPVKQKYIRPPSSLYWNEFDLSWL